MREYARMAPAAGPITSVDALVVALSALTYFVDVVTDILVSIQQYFACGDYVWAALAITFIIVPTVLMQVFSFKWYFTDGAVTWKTIVIHLLGMAPLKRYVEILKSWRQVRNSEEENIFLQMNDIFLLRLFEAFIESAPQLILQGYVTIYRQELHWITGLSLTASLISMAWGFASYIDILHLTYNNRYKRRWMRLMLQTFWQIGMLSSRVFALVLVAVCFKGWLFLALGIHWVLMTLWVISQKPNFSQTWWKDKLFSCIVGVIHIFCFLNVQDGKTRWRMFGFYGLIFVEDSLIVLAWFLMPVATLMNTAVVPSVIYTGFGIGSVCLLLYYGCCNPTEFMSTRQNFVREPRIPSNNWQTSVKGQSDSRALPSSSTVTLAKISPVNGMSQDEFCHLEDKSMHAEDKQSESNKFYFIASKPVTFDQPWVSKSPMFTKTESPCILNEDSNLQAHSIRFVGDECLCQGSLPIVESLQAKVRRFEDTQPVAVDIFWRRLGGTKNMSVNIQSCPSLSAPLFEFSHGFMKSTLLKSESCPNTQLAQYQLACRPSFPEKMRNFCYVRDSKEVCNSLVQQDDKLCAKMFGKYLSHPQEDIKENNSLEFFRDINERNSDDQKSVAQHDIINQRGSKLSDGAEDLCLDNFKLNSELRKKQNCALDCCNDSEKLSSHPYSNKSFQDNQCAHKTSTHDRTESLLKNHMKEYFSGEKMSSYKEETRNNSGPLEYEKEWTPNNKKRGQICQHFESDCKIVPGKKVLVEQEHLDSYKQDELIASSTYDGTENCSQSQHAESCHSICLQQTDQHDQSKLMVAAELKQNVSCANLTVHNTKWASAEFLEKVQLINEESSQIKHHLPSGEFSFKVMEPSQSIMINLENHESPSEEIQDCRTRINAEYRGTKLNADIHGIMSNEDCHPGTTVNEEFYNMNLQSDRMAADLPWRLDYRFNDKCVFERDDKVIVLPVELQQNPIVFRKLHSDLPEQKSDDLSPESSLSPLKIKHLGHSPFRLGRSVDLFNRNRWQAVLRKKPKYQDGCQSHEQIKLQRSNFEKQDSSLFKTSASWASDVISHLSRLADKFSEPSSESNSSTESLCHGVAKGHKQGYLNAGLVEVKAKDPIDVSLDAHLHTACDVKNRKTTSSLDSSAKMISIERMSSCPHRGNECLRGHNTKDFTVAKTPKSQPDADCKRVLKSGNQHPVNTECLSQHKQTEVWKDFMLDETISFRKRQMTHSDENAFGSIKKKKRQSGSSKHKWRQESNITEMHSDKVLRVRNH